MSWKELNYTQYTVKMISAAIKPHLQILQNEVIYRQHLHTGQNSGDVGVQMFFLFEKEFWIIRVYY